MPCGLQAVDYLDDRRVSLIDANHRVIRRFDRRQELYRHVELVLKLDKGDGIREPGLNGAQFLQDGVDHHQFRRQHALFERDQIDDPGVRAVRVLRAIGGFSDILGAFFQLFDDCLEGVCHRAHRPAELGHELERGFKTVGNRLAQVCVGSDLPERSFREIESCSRVSAGGGLFLIGNLRARQ